MLRTLLVSIVVTMGLVGAALACTCPPLRFDPERYSAVFVGRVEEVVVTDPDGDPTRSSSNDPVLVTFDIKASWRGIEGPTAIVQTARGGSSCGYRFGAGETYFVTASGRDEELVTSLCAHNAPLPAAVDMITALGPPDYLEPGFQLPTLAVGALRSQLLDPSGRRSGLQRAAELGIAARPVTDVLDTLVGTVSGDTLGWAITAALNVNPDDGPLVDAIAERLSRTTDAELASILRALGSGTGLPVSTTPDGLMYFNSPVASSPRIARLIPSPEEMLGSPVAALREAALYRLPWSAEYAPMTLGGEFIDDERHVALLRRGLDDPDVTVRTAAWQRMYPEVTWLPGWGEGEIQCRAEAAMQDDENEHLAHTVATFVIRAVRDYGPTIIDHVSVMTAGIETASGHQIPALARLADQTSEYAAPPDVLCRICDALLEFNDFNVSEERRRGMCPWLGRAECE